MPRFGYALEIEADDRQQADNILRQVLGTSQRAGSNLWVVSNPDLHDTELARLIEQEEAIERDMRRAEAAVREATRPNTYPWAVCNGDRVVDRHVTREGAFAAAAGTGYCVMRMDERLPGPGERLSDYGILLMPEDEYAANPEPRPPTPFDYVDSCSCSDCERVRYNRNREERAMPRRLYGVKTSFRPKLP